MADKNIKFIFIELVAIVGYALLWIFFSLNHWADKTTLTWNSVESQYLVNILLGEICLVTAFFMVKSSTKLTGAGQKLFLFTGISFLVDFFTFTYLNINILYKWQGIDSFAEILKNLAPNISLSFVLIPNFVLYQTDFILIITANQIFLVAVYVLALVFLIYPMEKYSAMKERPWRSLSMAISIIVLFLLIPISNIPNGVTIITIIGLIVLFVVIFDISYLFYQYLSTAVKSPKKSALRRGSFLIGIGFLIIITLMALKLFFLVATEAALQEGLTIVNIIIRTIISIFGLVIFSYGFYVIKPS